jgi:hypothetical protein
MEATPGMAADMPRMAAATGVRVGMAATVDLPAAMVATAALVAGVAAVVAVAPVAMVAGTPGDSLLRAARKRGRPDLRLPGP